MAACRSNCLMERSPLKIWQILRNMDKYIASIILFSMVGMVILQVTMRTVFSLPMIGPEELGRYFNICIVFLAAPYAARCGQPYSHERSPSVIAAKNSANCYISYSAERGGRVWNHRNRRHCNDAIKPGQCYAHITDALCAFFSAHHDWV